MLFSIKSIRLVIVGSDSLVSSGFCFSKSTDILMTDNGFLKSWARRPDNSPIADKRSALSNSLVFSSTRFSRLSLCLTNSFVLSLIKLERFLLIINTIRTKVIVIPITAKIRLSIIISSSSWTKIESVTDKNITREEIIMVRGIPNLEIFSKFTLYVKNKACFLSAEKSTNFILCCTAKIRKTYTNTNSKFAKCES